MGFSVCTAILVVTFAATAAMARTPEVTPGTLDVPNLPLTIWNPQFEHDDDHYAQQTPAPDAAAPGSTTTPAPAPAAPAANEASPPTTEEDVLPDLTGEPSADDISVGEIPAVETIELTSENARKAIDAYVLIREKYKDAALENYENLQDFVDKDPRGKEFETDIKSFGFATANDWNVAITTVGFAYSNLLDDQTEDIKQQIEEVKADTEMAQDMRERMVQALSAMIPSDNNKKIVDEMMKDAVYGEKLKQLETEEE
jgi:hypothetical protein